MLVEPPGVHISEQALKEICRHYLPNHIEHLVGAELLANLPQPIEEFLLDIELRQNLIELDGAVPALFSAASSSAKSDLCAGSFFFRRDLPHCRRGQKCSPHRAPRPSPSPRPGRNDCRRATQGGSSASDGAGAWSHA